ncbi:thioredoxin family protein [Caldibacillus lycopersici]|uniref:Thioredoxin family protein n=1 Tax=Perspicuibacillus lycopersici TaxID=1325689 RepID=A0AAE3ITB0_9BACI|nr:thioredoxin family protein [Perspicuibacillus lycopersici]MCU9614243.1 thioredoxin family protein [Perspicuibacillus lycopersici]
MEQLTSMEQFETLKNEGITVFVFSANWCSDCRFMEPFMPEVEAKFNQMNFIKVDRDQFIDLCADLSIFGIPSFVAFQNGKEVGRFVSKDRKTQEEIESFLNDLEIQ